ncbi:MAG TPA: glycosyltransferase [Mesotoga sp.]|nr:glycosyltransferase [Mesotoga sp.]HPX22124.1 glycosyltransferase [Mesotoga sp.]
MSGLKHDSYDIVVGIPSFNNRSTIKHVVEVSSRGLKEYFPELKSCIVNSDGGSGDGTEGSFYSANSMGLDLLSFKYTGISGKGSAMRSILELASRLGAKAVVFLDSDLRSVEPFWIERLAGPIINLDASYVAPYYIRHKYDGTITNSICYPLTTSLYGRKVRQPIGGDFGVGREMIDYYVSMPVEAWNCDISRFGIDIWMTTSAINEARGKIYQAALGSKIHDVKDPGKQLGNMFREVVGTLFALMEKYREKWEAIAGYETVPVYGEAVGGEAEPLQVDMDNMMSKCYEGIRTRLDFSESVLGGEITQKLSTFSKENAIVADDLWVEVVYKISSAYRKRELRSRLIELLVPVYFARVAGFVARTLEMNQEEAERETDRLLERFVDTKEELRKVWEKNTQ